MNIVSFGGGTNSTAMIIGMYLHKIPIDLILFADTGGEQPHTYEFIRVFNAWLARHTGAQGHAENEQVRKGHGPMLYMKKVIVICREVNRQTGQIAVYVVPMEIDEHTVVRLSLRSMFNPELRYFFVYEDVYQEQKQEITAMLKRRNITKQEVDSVYGIAEVGR